jgi:hypothetical protein
MSQTITGAPGTYSRYSSFTLVELERRVATGVGTFTSTFYRYCNSPQALTYNGAAGFDRPAVGAFFSARSFPNPAIVSDGQLGNATQLQFDDYDDVFKILAVQYDMIDWRVRIWEAGVDSTFTITWIKLKVKGRTEDKTWDVQASDTFTLDVASNGAVTDTSAPREIYSPSCRFVRQFKGDRCGYAGIQTSCDGQLGTCTSYGNQLRFGGFPDAPIPGTVIGLWGGAVQYDPRTFPQTFALMRST